MNGISVAILAGGLATRLYPVTETYPKSLIEINGTPFIKHQLLLLESKGIKDVVLCLGKFSEKVMDFLDSENFTSLKIKYSLDGEKLLGTGGAVRKAMQLLSDPFGVLYGDSFLNIDYIDIINYFNKLDKLGLMTVIRNEDKWDKSNVVFKNNEILKYDKSGGHEFNHIDYGFNILRKKAFNDFTLDNFDLKDVLAKLIKNNDLSGFEVFNRFYEIGSFEGIKETENILTLRVVVRFGHRLVVTPDSTQKAEDLPPGIYHVYIVIYADNLIIGPAWYKIKWKADYSSGSPCSISNEASP
ncbi:MAG: sugar phosphate nucleotidyltransferase, partial [Ignavibacteria bacterium]|nr:sugar phosphate nucleotidyltransferase [Ignavibacteria bacterium]